MNTTIIEVNQNQIKNIIARYLGRPPKDLENLVATLLITQLSEKEVNNYDNIEKYKYEFENLIKDSLAIVHSKLKHKFIDTYYEAEAMNILLNLHGYFDKTMAQQLSAYLMQPINEYINKLNNHFYVKSISKEIANVLYIFLVRNKEEIQ